MAETIDRTDQIARLRDRLETTYGAGEGRLLLAVAPGRSEIAGNHTDHEGGHVIAGAVQKHAVGLYRPNGTRLLRLASAGFDPVEVSLNDLAADPSEYGKTSALVRGLAALFAERGYTPAGFDAVAESGVPAGSGLSSSAAFELLVAAAMNALWADGALSQIELAQMAQRVENEWFGKPCGLMDQASCALGGIQHMGFGDPAHVEVEGIDLDFADAGYALCLVAVGADHAAKTDDYAAVPGEMQAVARALGATRLGELTRADVLARTPQLRRDLGDRPVLRALHYFHEDALVEARAAALAADDIDRFLALENASGASSAMYLQNIGGAVESATTEQPAMVALAVATSLLEGEGAVRIHGGGFGGTIQAFVPKARLESFVAGMDAVFGSDACQVCQIDHEGARAQWL